MRIVGIAGSLLPNAYVGRLLRAATHELPAPVDLSVFDGLAQVPRAQDGPPPAPVAALYDELARSAGLLVVAPAHSVLPSQLVHALDWAASRHGGTVLVGKPAVVITACLPGHEAMWTQVRLQRALAAAGAEVHGADLGVASTFRHFDAQGRAGDPAVRTRLRAAMRHLHRPAAVLASGGAAA
ncbi:hypothetical protein Sme01_67820 [Sphaerisporangium melleum]|uniref:NADPH-dependent FMN reductase-like domain-containing protein n=1 Tax=Sphaerisporangium melleum TaxID=321316 RepID=A0A917RH90_9ACTN|nr:NAD(P)H-dependent oxidoreductase [Sphaerisporangium melleum]GGL08085.1 hypothetical protein GCM10007964_57910 [Sphaerisporangium melleum]GII74306.1 hypothetical protein Sme01_67820 [Sphaerisporangium melleum]